MGYYSEKLAAEKLRRCYKIAPPRVRQYLNAEIEHVLGKIRSGDVVLELGCGYGRVLARLLSKAQLVVGIDTSLASLHLAKEHIGEKENCNLIATDAVRLGLRDDSFDVVICIQNGISAFHVDPVQLFSEAARVTRPGGCLLFSTYTEKFWPHRIQWFELQAEAGLLGEIDYPQSGNGQVICKDGFRATTFAQQQFRDIAAELGLTASIKEVDQSSVFCQITVP